MQTTVRPQEDLRALIAAQQCRYDVSGVQIAAALGMSKTKWYTLRTHLDGMTLGELSALKKFLHISTEDLLANLKI